MRQDWGNDEWYDEFADREGAVEADHAVDDGAYVPAEPVEGLGYRRGSWILGGMAVVTVASLAFAAVAVFSGDDPAPTGLSVPPRVTATASLEGSLAPSSGEEAASPTSVPSSASPSPRTAPSAKRSITPSKRPVAETPIPAPSAVKPTGACPTHPGPTSTKAQVRTQLGEAAGYTYWRTSAPSLRVPLDLLKAVAWQESGWQSSILACDGGIGTMQIMPNTLNMMNSRFGTSWDADAFRGNIMVGGQYLAWLIKYMGDVYYGGVYDVTADTSGGFLNAVISGYQAGAAAVDPTKGSAGIPNWPYVNNVRALMKNCPCLTA